MIVSIYVGIPENDKMHNISDTATVKQVLDDCGVSVKGSVQHNGRTLSGVEITKTLAELGFANNDSLHVVKKLDNA
jgi:hypothetical protein